LLTHFRCSHAESVYRYYMAICLKPFFVIWVNWSFKERLSETSIVKERWPFQRNPSFTKHSVSLRQDWVNVPLFPLLIPPLPLPLCRDLLAWFIWWKEFCTELWLWWYPYTVTFSPHQMFFSQNMVMITPKSPDKHIKWSLRVYAGYGRHKWHHQWHECWGLEGRQGGNGREEQTERETEISDICSHQLTTPGWPGGVRGDRGHIGADNSHKCCNGWYLGVQQFAWIW